ncbi:MAG: N-acyl-D-amino-acid deacylase family protein [Acidobacteriota bacterium]
MKRIWIVPVLLAMACQGSRPPDFDVLIRGGQVYDGAGGPSVRADIGIRGDQIAHIGPLDTATAAVVLDASNRAVAPGFINMLSWSTDSLLADGNSQGEVRQGVTTQIMGEGDSMGPLTDEMKKRREAGQGDIKFPIQWTTLAEYLQFLEKKGVAQNVASFVGATTLREYAVGLEDKDPTAEQMELMRRLVRQEMEAGALGIGSSLIYPPAAYAETAELIELCKVAAQYQGKYISHMRSEANRLVEAVQELIRISREAGLPAEIYHLKAAGQANWRKLAEVIALVEEARAAGLKITADMYTYTAGSTGLSACIPPWAQSGGPEEMRRRFQDPAQRRRILQEIVTPTHQWENFYTLVGNPERILVVEFKKAELKSLQGKTLAEIARLRKKDPPEVILDLMTEDETRVGAVYFLMSEDNVKKQIGLDWVSFGSDAGSMAAEGVFLRSSSHPRAYGNFARLLGK